MSNQASAGYESKRGFRRPYTIHYEVDGQYQSTEMQPETSLHRALKYALDVDNPLVRDATGGYVAGDVEEIEALRVACVSGHLQAQVHGALTRLRTEDPELERRIRESMPAFACEDLNDPEAGAVLAYLEEEGLL